MQQLVLVLPTTWAMQAFKDLIIRNLPASSALVRRLSMATKSVTAAKVVPKPAAKPNTSDRLNVGRKRLAASRVSCVSDPQKPVSAGKASKSPATKNLLSLEGNPFTYVIPTCGSGSDESNADVFH